jgi:hypothetical protein
MRELESIHPPTADHQYQKTPTTGAATRKTQRKTRSS